DCLLILIVTRSTLHPSTDSLSISSNTRLDSMDRKVAQSDSGLGGPPPEGARLRSILSVGERFASIGHPWAHPEHIRSRTGRRVARDKAANSCRTTASFII
ncbi:hypothetical protein PMAYCL1PPCAC_07142, partial [Pristionchus mayeri]